MFLSTRDGFLNHCPVKPFVINLDFFVFYFIFFCGVSRQTVILVLLVLIY